MDKEKTKVVFRVWPDGDVIALFPQIPADLHGYMCQSYMHVGQHGAADTDISAGQTRLATPKEFIKLKRELRQRGYNLQVGKRCTRKDFEIRRAEAEKSYTRWGRE